MAARIKQEFGIEAVLTKGRVGIFEVFMNKKIIYSNHQSALLPTDEEIFQSIRAEICGKTS
jgi:predicted Rdx family selenoprotein